MPPEPSLALDASLAPAQIYIVLAITVASFSWLLKPEPPGQLTGRQVFIGFLLIFIQFLHLVSYQPVAKPRVAPRRAGRPADKA